MMASPEFDAEATIRAMAPALGLTLDEEEIVDVAIQLTRMAELAAALDVALDDGDDVAPTFQP